MIKRSLFLLFISIFLTGCTGGKTDRYAAIVEHSPPMKQDIPHTFVEKAAIVPIATNEYSFVEVSEWFNEDTVIFLKDENGTSYLQLHQLTTGKQQDFFQIDEPIVFVSANDNYNLFAIQTVSFDDSTPLYIINAEGRILYQLKEIGEDFTFFWNPYRTDQMIVVSFLPNWEFDVYQLSVKEGQLRELDIQQTYFQWINENTLAYLDWDMEEPNFVAPLYTVDMNSGQKKKIFDEVVGFFAYPNNTLLTITVNSLEDEYSTYTFYDSELNLLGSFLVPTLNTYSEQWWIPFQAFHGPKRVFYYQRPLYSSAFFEYNDPFELVRYDLEEQIEEVVGESDFQVPMKLSPNGEWMLYGNQLEMVVDVRKKKTYSIVP